MTNGLLGKKLGMTQIFDETRFTPVTVIEAGPCRVVTIKTKERDGYESVQLSFGEVKERKLSRAEMGHLKKTEAPATRVLREFQKVGEVTVGQSIKVDIFQKGDWVDLKGQKVGSVDLPGEVFGCKLHTALVHEVVVMQRACERQGRALRLRRGEVAGSGKKPWKQKHTGRARAGSIRSPVWRHGGSVFGPKPRDYSYSMPKRKYRAALQSALSAKLADGQVVIVSNLSLDQPKTKLLAQALANLGAGAYALIVAGVGHTALAQAAGNLPDVSVVGPEGLNVYDIVSAELI